MDFIKKLIQWRKWSNAFKWSPITILGSAILTLATLIALVFGIHSHGIQIGQMEGAKIKEEILTQSYNDGYDKGYTEGEKIGEMEAIETNKKNLAQSKKDGYDEGYKYGVKIGEMEGVIQATEYFKEVFNGMGGGVNTDIDTLLNNPSPPVNIDLDDANNTEKLGIASSFNSEEINDIILELVKNENYPAAKLISDLLSMLRSR